MRRGVFVADCATDAMRAWWGLVAGTTLFVLFWVALGLIRYALVGPGNGVPWDALQPRLASGMSHVVDAAPMLFFKALIGLFIFGVPIWWGLHRLHLRGWGAITCGGALGRGCSSP